MLSTKKKYYKCFPKQIVTEYRCRKRGSVHLNSVIYDLYTKIPLVVMHANQKLQLPVQISSVVAQIRCFLLERIWCFLSITNLAEDA